jgi:hypothetical protein
VGGREVLQLFNFAEKSPAFAILLKSSPLILRHLNKAVFGKTGNFQQNQIFATLPHVTYARSAFCKRGREKALGFARG